jgi:hypothetical protein
VKITGTANQYLWKLYTALAGLPRVVLETKETAHRADSGHAVAYFVEALCYKPEGCGFGSQ